MTDTANSEDVVESYPDFDSLYEEYFPTFTCPISRHARNVADMLVDSESEFAKRIDEWEPSEQGRAIALTVAMLWKTRSELAKVKGERDEALEVMRGITCHECDGDGWLYKSSMEPPDLCGCGLEKRSILLSPIETQETDDD